MNATKCQTENDGHVVARTDHQAFGEEIGVGVGLRKIEQGYSADKATRQGYGLTENDESSGQQHTWFRKLETQAGRWTSPDPYKGSMQLGDPQSFNRFAYVLNDPVNTVDPSGLDGVREAVGLAQQLLKNPACRKAVDAAKGIKSDLASDLGRLYQRGKITLRSNVLVGEYINGKVVADTQPFQELASATTSFYRRRVGGVWIPYHISLNQNNLPFSANANERFGAFVSDSGLVVGSVSRLESMALTILHEYRHWRGDRSGDESHLTRFNAMIYYFCLKFNPFDPNRRHQPVEESSEQPGTMMLSRPISPLPGGGGGVGPGGGDPFRSISWTAFLRWSSGGFYTEVTGYRINGRL